MRAPTLTTVCVNCGRVRRCAELVEGVPLCANCLRDSLSSLGEF